MSLTIRETCASGLSEVKADNKSNLLTDLPLFLTRQSHERFTLLRIYRARDFLTRRLRFRYPPSPFFCLLYIQMFFYTIMNLFITFLVHVTNHPPVPLDSLEETNLHIT
jgi:hypothetical protein